MEQRLRDGASSIRTTEAILYIFRKEKHSLDEAMKGYQSEHLDCGGDVAEAICDDVLRVRREKLLGERRASDTTSRLLKSRGDFHDTVEPCFLYGFMLRT